MGALLAQISDPHIVAEGQDCLGMIDTAGFLRRAVSAIGELANRPDAVIVTGDLVNDGTVPEYTHLRALLAPLAMPVLLQPGNHDDPATLRSVFPDHPELGTHGPCTFDLMVADLRVIGLDTSVPGRPGGDLGAEQVAWVEGALAARPDTPTIIAMHHPPFATGIAHMDAMGLDAQAAAALAAVVAGHPQVERVICGHLHRTISTRWAGTIAATAPSVAHAVALDLAPGARPGWTTEPPGITLHHLDGQRVVTHLAPIGDYPPRPFA